MHITTYPVTFEIDLAAVQQNVRAVRTITGVDAMAVVKANAYGYGAVPLARAAVAGGAAWLGVARVDEALLLRQAGFSQPILVLGMVPYAQIDDCIRHQITLPLGSDEAAVLCSERARAVGVPLDVHLKVDTGMGRLGVYPQNALALAQCIVQLPMLHLGGIFSHIANADRQEDRHAGLQITRFKQAVDALTQANLRPEWVHLSNTAAALSYPTAWFNLVRGGQMLVGHNSFSDRPLHPLMRLAMHSWKTGLAACLKIPSGQRLGDTCGYTTLTDELIGVVPAGFGDGYWRQPGSHVLVGGKRQPVLGLPEFDCMYIGLDQPYAPGSEVLLAGTQGRESITIQDLAARWGTGPGKITSVIPQHVARIYEND